MPNRKVHAFCYYNYRRRGRTLKPAHLRDGHALFELMDVMIRRGFEHGELFLNTPPTVEELDEHDWNGPVAEVDESFLHPDDVLLILTRPPFSDLYHHDKVHSQPGFTSLERKMFEEARTYIAESSRSHLRLQPEVAKHLKEEYQTRADITFRQVKDPYYRECFDIDGHSRKRFRKQDRRTAAFLLYLDHAPSIGSGLVLAFGMGSTETLVWARRLRTDFSHLFDKPGFTMVEMVEQQVPERPTRLSFAPDWKIDVALRIDL